MSNFRATASDSFALFRENPFRPLYLDAHGFREPPRRGSPADELRPWKFRTEETAKLMARTLNGTPNAFGRRDPVYFESYRKVLLRALSQMETA